MLLGFYFDKLGNPLPFGKSSKEYPFFIFRCVAIAGSRT